MKNRRNATRLFYHMSRHYTTSSSSNMKLNLDKDFIHLITQPINNPHQERIKNTSIDAMNNKEKNSIDDNLSFIRGLINNGRVDEALLFVSTKVTPTFQLYSFLVNEFVNIKRMDLVWQIFDRVLQNRETMRPTLQFMKTMLRTCVKCIDDGDYFNSIVSIMEEEGMEFDADCYYLIMKHHIKFKNHHKVMETFKVMDEKNIKAGDKVFSLLINLFFRSGEEDKAWKLFEQFKRYNKYPSYYVSLVIVNHLCNHRDALKQAEQIVNSLPIGIVSPHHYVFLVKGFIRNHQYSDALDIIQNMRLRKIAPTMDVYRPLLHEYIDIGDQQGLEQLLQTMVEDRTLSPTDPLYQCYRVAAACVSGNMDEAYNIYNSMLSRGYSVQPMAVKYLVRGFLIKRNPAVAMDVYQSYTDKTGNIDPEIYAQFIRYEATNGNIRAALKYFQELKRTTLPRSIDYIYLIVGSIKGGYIEQAMNFFNEMKRDNINVRYSFLLSVLAELFFSGYFEQARKVFDDISTKFKHFHGPDSYAIMISAHIKNGEFDLAHQYYDNMKAAKIEPNEQLYSLMLRMYSYMGTEQELDQMFQELLKNKDIKPTMRIYNSVMRAKVESDRTDQAVEYYRTLIEENQSLIPFPQMMYTLFCGFIYKDDVASAVEIIEQMNNSSDFIAGPRMYLQLSTAYENIGDYDMAHEAKIYFNHLVTKYTPRFGRDRNKVASMYYISEEDFMLTKYLIDTDRLRLELKAYGFDPSEVSVDELPAIGPSPTNE
jgi:pentatricopeptide repeat protein